MTLDKELEKMFSHATTEQKTRFNELLKDVQSWEIPSTDKLKNNRFLALVLLRRELDGQKN